MQSADWPALHLASGHVYARSVLVIVGVVLVFCLLAACAPRQFAPVEDRSPAQRPTTPAAQPQPAPPVYEVRRGDTLYSISFRYGLDWRRVADWNGIQAPYTIRPGQELRLSEPPAVAATRPAPASSGQPGSRPTPPTASPRPRASTPASEVESSPPAASQPAPASSASTASSTTRNVAGIDWQWPTDGSVQRLFDPAATRRGLGIAGRQGQPVLAAADGEVVYSGTALIGYGELVIIKHSESMLSAYGHNSRRLVEEGDRVRRGQPIAEMGMNERDDEILHFEIRRNGQAEDPLRFLPHRN